MKKVFLISLLILALISMLFLGISCKKTEAVTETTAATTTAGTNYLNCLGKSALARFSGKIY